MSNFSKNALKIYEKLYINKSLGETKPLDVHTRVAKFISNNDEEYSIFFNMINDRIFMPNTPTLMNAGREIKNIHDGQLMACFVFGLEDSMESIVDWWSFCALTYASGAGVGTNITNLREKGASVRLDGFASGPQSYSEVIQVISDKVMSGGRKDGRRAANMGVANFNHPDILDIIDMKQNVNLEAFNISISVTDKFMQFVNDNKFDITIDLISPNGNKKVGETTVGIIWDKIIYNCHKNGDPGLFFYDTANKTNSFPSMGSIQAVNVCGEIPLPNFSACTLGTLNLNKFIINNKINYDALKQYAKYGNTFLDNVIDKTTYIHPKIEKRMKSVRSVGLGVMGFADILVSLGIPYNSEEGRNIFKEICKTITVGAIENSIERCNKKEVKSIDIPINDHDHFVNLLENYGVSKEHIKMFEKTGIRNNEWTSLPPNGSTSIICDCSYSFEPLSAIVWEKQLSGSEQNTMKFIYEPFEEWLDNYLQNGKDSQEYIQQSKDSILNKIVENHGSIKGIPEIPKPIQRIFVSAHDIDPFDKIDMQSVGQEYISLGISSTCNLPNSATIKDISNIYKYAWKKGLKGITIYRDGCREWQPMNFGSKKIENQKETMDTIHKINSLKSNRKTVTFGKTVKLATPYGNVYVTLNKDDNGNPCEIFVRTSKTNVKEHLYLDTITTLISKLLQNGFNPKILADELRDRKYAKFYFRTDENQIKPYTAESDIDAIGILIEEFFCNEEIQEINEIPVENKKVINNFKTCPVCGERTLNMNTGCKSGQCLNESCYYTACG